MEEILDFLHSYLWNGALVFLILFMGIYLSFKTRFIQIRKFGLGLKLAFKKSEGEGDISSFGALCTSLAACLGTGNIAGVAIAVSLGGPGAIFWMVVSAFWGMATKYCEGFLGLKYREKRADGFIGGPFLYIEKGMGRKFLPLSRIFAFFGMTAGLVGIGGIAQINTVSLSLEAFFDPQKNSIIKGSPYSLCLIICGVLTATAASISLLGGIKRISAVSTLIVPFMTVIFLICSCLIIILNFSRLGTAFSTIMKSAFTLRSGSGAVVGIGLQTALSEGVGRGVFSNEAGIGTASISMASSRENEPVRAGLITMIGTFIDTILLCTLTGLAVVLTDSHSAQGVEGAAITALSWQKGLPFDERLSAFLLNMCLFFFGFTSIIGWSCYALKCAEYFFKNRKTALKIYKAVYISALYLGPFISLALAWKLADLCNAFLALPNLVALFFLSGTLKKETDAFFNRNEEISARKCKNRPKNIKKL